MSLSLAAKFLGTDFSGTDHCFSGVSIDTRTLEAGQLFVAIKGENFNGHEFVNVAQQKGAAAALVSESVTTDLPCLKVDDTLSGLQRLAANWRAQFDLPVIAITGSNGKTTVKELAGSILSAHYEHVLVTRGNLNNHLGVPLTLLRLNNCHQCAVIEMGMNHAGEITELTRLAKPDVALVNNAMLAHVEAFDSVLDVAAAKSEIFQGLSAGGVAVINADDPNYEFIRQQAGSARCIDFAIQNKARVMAQISHKHDHVQMKIETPVGCTEVKLNLLGQHNAMNALAATACALALDVNLESIKQGLERVIPVKGRLQPIRLANGVVVLNDTYNANPDSMKAGIDVLAKLPGSKKILVAGDMGELGEQSPQLHKDVGDYAAEHGVDAFLSLGPCMKLAANAYGGNGYNTSQIDNLLSRLAGECVNDCTILVKGSRSMRMERVIEALTCNGGSNDKGGLQ